ncbi:MAG: hypothetical protein LKM30_01110 [Bacilli bacterium]|jgi:hypothetical protein|nr:hypothetical protein [Bacilli bacterium]
MKRSALLSLVLLSCFLASCQKPTSASAAVSDSTAASDSASDSTSAETTYTTMSAFKALQDPTARYHLVVNRYKSLDGESLSEANYYFAPDYFVNRADMTLANPIDTGYLHENGGVSSFTYNQNSEKLVRSELLSDTSGVAITTLSSVAPFFSNVPLTGISQAEDGSLDFAARKKSVLALFKTFGIDDANFFYLVSFKATMVNHRSPNSLRFEAKFSTTNGTGAEETVDTTYYYTGSIAKYGSSQINYLEDFVANPLPAFVPTDEEKRVRALFNGKNFTQYRDDDGDNTDDQFDYFTNQYYYVTFTDAYKAKDAATVAQYGNRGYLAIDNKTMNYTSGTTTTPLVFLGCYLIQSTDGKTLSIITRPDPSNSYYAQSAFTQVYTDISKVMNYPCYLKCLISLETASQDSDKKTLTYTDSDVLADFVTNFNLQATMTANKLTADYLTLTYNLATADKDCSVTMDLHFVDSKAYAEYVFKDFGSTKVSLVDDFITTNGLAM